MTNSNATTLKCQNASRQRDVHRHRRRVGQRQRAPTARPAASTRSTPPRRSARCCRTWLGRNGMNGSGGWVPIRVGLNDVNAYYDGTQVQIGHTPDRRQVDRLDRRRRRTSSATASTTRPRAASPAAAPRSSSPTPSARPPSGSPTTRPTSPTSPSARRSTWSARARSATCTTRRPSVTPTATRRRSRAARCTRRPVPATTGSTCWPRAPTRPTASRPARPATARRSPASGSRRRSRSCTTRCC